MKKLILLLLFIPLISFGQVDSGMSLNRNIDDLYVSGTRIVDIKSQFNVDHIIAEFEHMAIRDSWRIKIDWGQRLPTDQKGKAFKPYVSSELVPTKNNIIEAKSIGAWISYLSSKGWVYYDKFDSIESINYSRYIFKFQK